MPSDREPKRTKSPSKSAEAEKKQGRRDVLKGGVVIGSAAVASALALPKKWTRPLVDVVVVPAHAQISPGAPTPAPTGAPTSAPTPSPTPGGA